MRKRIILNNTYSNYEIDDSGNIYNIITKKKLKGSISESGYLYYRLSLNGIKYRFYAHLLVAQYFLKDDYNTRLVVNHKDGNKLNNSIENLECITLSENVRHAHTINLINKKKNMDKEPTNLDKEIWKETKECSKYLVSNFGRVKSVQYGKERILKPSLANGYLKVSFSTDNVLKDYLIHYLVFFNFNEAERKEGYVINHKDGNKRNNNLDNLEYISRQENTLKAYYEQKLCKNIKPVDCYYNGKFVKTFNSCAEAARELNLDNSSISKVCRGIYSHTHNYVFRYREGSTTIREE